MRSLKFVAAVVAAAGGLSAAAPAFGGTVTWYMTNLFSGSPVAPDGHLRATLENVTPNRVTLTLFANWASTTQFAGADGFYFNVNPNIANPNATYNLVHTSGQVGSTALATEQYSGTGGNMAFHADGNGGYFDATISFASGGAGRLTAGESSVFSITRDDGGLIAPEDFLFGSDARNSSSVSYLAATHIQGVANGSGGQTSSWLSPGELPPPVTLVPLPTTAGLASAGLLALAARRRRR